MRLKKIKKLSIREPRDERLKDAKQFRPFSETSDRWGNRIQEYYENTYTTQSLSSLSRIRSYFIQFLKFIGERDMDEKTLGEYVRHLWDKCPTQAGRAIVYPKAFIREEVDEGRMRRKLLKILNVKQISPPVKEPITYDEFQQFIKSTDHPEIVWLYTLAWNTGMQMADCATLRWSDVDLSKLCIERKRKKMALRQNGLAIIPIQAGTDVHNMLCQYRKRWMATTGAEESDFVCPELGNKYIDGSLGVYCARHRKSLGINKPFTCFRISMASALHESGAGLINAMRVLGHSSPDTTKRYLRVNKDRLREKIQAANQVRIEAGDDMSGLLGFEQEEVPIGGGATIPMTLEDIQPFRLWLRKPSANVKKRSKKPQYIHYISGEHQCFYKCDEYGRPDESCRPRFFRLMHLILTNEAPRAINIGRVKELDTRYVNEATTNTIQLPEAGTATNVPTTGKEGSGGSSQVVVGY